MLGYIALGSNIGDRGKNIRTALGLMRQVPGLAVRRVSAFRNTKPVGGPPQGDYLNAVAEIDTDLPPRTLLSELQKIENRIGRTRDVHWGPRTIDLDIVLLGDLVVDEPDLKIPHTLMHTRQFVLEPLCELAPDAMHPVLHRTAAELLNECMKHEGTKAP